MTRIGISVLGSTGSIGISTLDVVARHPERFRVVALTAHRDVAGLAAQCARFRPALAVLADPAGTPELHRRLLADAVETEVLTGVAGLEQAAALPDAQVVMAAIVGAAGLRPALAAARAGKRILLANKEALVMSGKLFIDEATRHGAEILPIDSEHNAIFQCLPVNFRAGLSRVGVRRILLTASGGPFRETPLERLREATPEQACAHPNWSMGRKISVDSATMMNKGLEVIEACWLFCASPETVEVVVHPQSIVHSLVEYVDGSVLAQLGNPDMRTPIAQALAWPERIASGVQSLDLTALGRLDFQAPDPRRFPCLRLAQEAAGAGGTAPAILNAANEVAVQAFLGRRIRFTDIPRVVQQVLERLPGRPGDSLEAVFSSDGEARGLAEQCVRGLA
jgi:1-deoxy-D-xylulose-5-phosphate reductoisomerase